MQKTLLLFLVLFLTVFNSFSQDVKKQKLQTLLDSLCIAGNFPGLSIAIAGKNSDLIKISSGYAEKEKTIKLVPSDRLLQGSVGKTYASTIAIQLVQSGKLDLENKVSEYLGQYEWYKRIPNAADITVRMLMNHTSGIMRYEFKPQFTADLTSNPSRYWKPEELLLYVFDEKANFKAGEGWEYSDTNYILLGLIIEKLTGKSYYSVLKEKILDPFKLENTLPSDKRDLKGLVQGYAGESNEFGGKDKVIGEDGLFIINPQFEWTGGGIYSTTSDLAKWGKLLYEGKVIDTAFLFNYAVPAKLGKDTKYGQGVIIRQTPLGRAMGHSGFFPGYMTEMLYFPTHGFCIAVQTNSSDFKNLRIGLLRVLMMIAEEYVES